MNFQNKVVLITGGSAGIGEACVRHFRQLGASISIVDIVRPPASTEGALVTVGDITDSEVRARVVRTTLDHFGKLDILVNNVGIGLYERASGHRDDEELQLFDTNVFSAIALAQLVIPHMKARREGWVANISSVGAYVGLPWSASYCASKSAIHSYSESLRRELHTHGVHVSTIVPGIVNTGFREHVLRGVAPEGVASIRQSVSPDDVARCVARAIARRKRRIFIPWYGRIFTGLDFFFPALMDAYIARQWSAADQSRAGSEDDGVADRKWLSRKSAQ